MDDGIKVNNRYSSDWLPIIMIYRLFNSAKLKIYLYSTGFARCFFKKLRIRVENFCQFYRLVMLLYLKYNV